MCIKYGIAALKTFDYALGSTGKTDQGNLNPENRPKMHNPGVLSNAKSITNHYFKTACNALTKGPRSMSEAAPNRQELDLSIKKMALSGRLGIFTQAVSLVNANFASNNDSHLSKEKKEQYQALTAAYQAGDISATYAFLQSACGWNKEKSSVEARVGMAFNSAAMVLACGHDYKDRSKGFSGSIFD
ncbi:MAG: hypothetical protein ON057_000348 [Glomeribacter sp. 1016415]|nr:hypothetical protein [Glomeribacter sp. 1016415]